MRYKVLIIFCAIFCNLHALANTTAKDSLLRLLPVTKQAQQKLKVYRSLADITYETPAEKGYLRHAYLEAIKANNTEEVLDILGDLCFSYIKEYKIDSANHYLNKIKKMEKCDQTTSWITYLNMRLFEQRISRESNKELFKDELNNKKKNSHANIYSELEYSYIIGSALLENKNYNEALPYIETANKLANKLPFKEGYKLQYMTLRSLSRNYTFIKNNTKATTLTEETLALLTKYYEQYLKKERPFYYINSFYITCYTSLFLNAIKDNPEKLNYYVDKIRKLLEKVESPRDKYSGLLSIYNYYVIKRDFKLALATNDSLIRYAQQIAPENTPGLYKISSAIYELTSNYKEALDALKISYAMQDSFNTFKSQEQLNQLQVKYDVDKLNYEKSQLEIKNKRILVITLSGVLAISIIISIYLYRNLKKERLMKVKLRELKNKAEESENMKTAFINSICHEIRTPLNSIVGFTDLIFNTSIDEEIRQSFPEEIQKNTNLLTSLINSMLEVSNLDVSDEKLPCDPVDLNAVCQREIDRLKESGKPAIALQLNIPNETLIIPSNERYLSLMIESLLNNANKFTETGQITLHFHLNKQQNKVEIQITDTGCGIPEEKHEEVFERFTKLDVYKPGNGLGLYLCRLIIKRLSGEIIIDPGYTDGTRFIITLPLN